MSFILNVRTFWLIEVSVSVFHDMTVHDTSLFSRPTGIPVNVTLSIVREQGSSGEVEIHYQTRPALYQPPSNQATAGQDYTPRDGSIVMMDGAAVALVTVTILPVRRALSKTDVHEICVNKEENVRIEVMFSFIYESCKARKHRKE